MSIDEVFSILEMAEKGDLDPHSGKLFAYVYETGDENIRKIAHNALQMFGEKNLLDFTVFKSAVLFEKEVVGFAKNLMHGDDNAVGSYTFGGTESIMLAVKVSRVYYRKSDGQATVREVLVPLTIQPAFL